MNFTRLFCSSFAALLLAVLATGPAFADDQKADDKKPVTLKRITRTKTPIPGVDIVDVFDAIKNKQIEVQLIAPNVEKANIKVINKSKKPLSIKFPAAFAGVPVLAQGIGGPGGGMGGGGFGGGGMGGRGGMGGGLGGGNQGFGGGMGGGGGMMGGGGRGGMGGGGGMMGGGGMGGGLFNIPAGKTGRVQIAIVCLEHDKKDPTSRVKYEIKPIETFAKNEVSAEVLKMMAEGEVHRDVVQASIWHLESGLSWRELASKDKVVSSFGGYSEKYFTLEQIIFAQQVCKVAAKRADALKVRKKSIKEYKDDTKLFE
ncbi:MAG: hypothetical protein VX438_03945 [Planctomycetota bacterium]|nr:hypothetical protein [Planctomycetota bacterium]